MRVFSALNTQPWHSYVVTGKVLNQIRTGNLASVPDSRKFRLGPDDAGLHCKRQIGIVKQLFGAMGIECDHKKSVWTECCAVFASATRRPRSW